MDIQLSSLCFSLIRLVLIAPRCQADTFNILLPTSPSKIQILAGTRSSQVYINKQGYGRTPTTVSLHEFRCYNHLGLLKHIRATHENDPNFCVYCSLCGKSYNKWHSFKKHLHHDHGMDNKAPKIIYVYVSVGTQCTPATSNSTPVDDVFDPNQQETEIDDYLVLWRWKAEVCQVSTPCHWRTSSYPWWGH